MSNALTLTVVSNMTSNYGETLGNISTVQKVYKNGKGYAIRSKESLKYYIMTQSGLYDDLETDNKGVCQKKVNQDSNASNTKALEGGYMYTGTSTTDFTRVRKSSFYLTDAVSLTPMVNELRFHTNLGLANNYSKANDIDIFNHAKDSGLNPFNYEYDKGLKKYSITINLDKVGYDDNFNEECTPEEKADRVISLLNAVESLSLVVKGNLDNAEPLLVVGGIGSNMTHYFDNLIELGTEKSIKLTETLKERLKGYSGALLEVGTFTNETDILALPNMSTSVSGFFSNLKKQVKKHYGVK